MCTVTVFLWFLHQIELLNTSAVRSEAWMCLRRINRTISLMQDLSRSRSSLVLPAWFTSLLASVTYLLQNQNKKRVEWKCIDKFRIYIFICHDPITTKRRRLHVWVVYDSNRIPKALRDYRGLSAFPTTPLINVFVCKVQQDKDVSEEAGCLNYENSFL